MVGEESVAAAAVADEEVPEIASSWFLFLSTKTIGIGRKNGKLVFQSTK
ncbi:hypothetical protein CCACVL1_22650, partial [Corchorus capsularis]